MYPITGIVPPRIEIPQELLPPRKQPEIAIPNKAETASVGVNCKTIVTKEMAIQTDSLPDIEDIDQMEFVKFEDVAIIAPPAQFSEPDDDQQEVSVQKPRIQENVKILNKSKTPSSPPKQFKKPSSIKTERVESTKPKILNSQLNTARLEEPLIHSIETISFNQTIEEEYLEEVDWDVKSGETQDKSDDHVVYTCDVCERSFPLQQQLVIHRKNHERERNHPCSDCDKSFFTKYDLAKHVLTHTKQKDYCCIVCKKSFSRSTLLYRHEKIHTCPKIPRHHCGECDRVYLNIADYEKHIITHTKNRPFACSYCEKSFAFKQGLERHEVSHDYISQPHPCQYCEMRFPSTARLQRHLSKEHAGTRPFPCSKCSKRFMLSHHLYRHMSTAHPTQDITSFQCPECDEVLDNRDDFFTHCFEHASHSFNCPLCKTLFDCNDDVQDHILVHSKSDMYYCDYCNLIYMTQDDLNTHFIDLHSNELCSVGEEFEIIITEKPKNVDDVKKRKNNSESSKTSKKARPQEDIITYIQEIDFLGDDYVESEVDGAAFVEYEEIEPDEKMGSDTQHLSVKHSGARKKSFGKSSTEEKKTEPAEKPAKTLVKQGRVRMSAAKVEQLKKEGKIKLVNGELMMKQ